MSRPTSRRWLGALLAPLALSISACANSGASSSAASSEEARPLPGASATLKVQGLSCPLCASNVDKQLLRVAGVSDVSVDLGEGIVKVRFDPDAPPSAAALRQAVEGSGFTLAGITTP